MPLKRNVGVLPEYLEPKREPRCENRDRCRQSAGAARILRPDPLESVVVLQLGPISRHPTRKRADEVAVQTARGSLSRESPLRCSCVPSIDDQQAIRASERIP